MAGDVVRPPLRLGRVLGRSLRVWGRGVVPFTAACAAPYLPLLAATALHQRPRRYCPDAVDVLLPLVVFVASCLFWLAMPAAVVDGVLRQLRGERVSVRGCLRAYGRALLPALGVGAIVGLFGIPCVVVCAHGYALSRAGELPGVTLGLAGAFLSSLFWVAVPAAAVERRGVVGSLRRSLELTRGARGRVFLVSAATLVLSTMPLFWFGSAGEGWVNALATIVASGYGAVACAVGYHDLRAAREGPRVGDLERVFA